MKKALSIIVFILALSSISMLTSNVRAHTGIRTNTPPWFWEGFKLQFNKTTDDLDFGSQYVDSRGPRASDAVAASEATNQPPFVQYIIVSVIVVLAVFGVYLVKTEKTPEKALKEAERSSKN